MKLAVFVVLCTFVCISAAQYDISGCEKFIKVLINIACEKHSGDKAIQVCEKCVTDAILEGKMDVTECKSYVPDKNKNCFDLAPLLQGFNAANLGADLYSCTGIDICRNLGEYVDQFKESEDKIEGNVANITIDGSCQKQAGEFKSRAWVAIEDLRNQFVSVKSRQGTKFVTNLFKAIQTMFGFTEDQMNQGVTCILSFFSTI